VKADARAFTYAGSWGCDHLVCTFCADGMVYLKFAGRTHGQHFKLTDVLVPA
jgi:hypothetical protein